MNDRELLEFIAAQVGTLNAKIDGMGIDIKDLKNGQLKIQSTIENDVNLKLSALFDGRDMTNEKLDILNVKVDDISRSLTGVELITSQNWNDIAKLKKAK